MRNNGNKQNEKTSVIREYSGLAPTYDIRWASYITATLRKTLKRLDIKPTDRVLDIGCGTGSLLQAIFQNHPSVNLIGLDISKEMLKVACNKRINICDLFLRMFNRAHFKTYGKDACERLLQNTGYGNIRVERYKINWLWDMMTAKAQTPVYK